MLGNHDVNCLLAVIFFLIDCTIETLHFTIITVFICYDTLYIDIRHKGSSLTDSYKWFPLPLSLYCHIVICWSGLCHADMSWNTFILRFGRNVLEHFHQKRKVQFKIFASFL